MGNVFLEAFLGAVMSAVVAAALTYVGRRMGHAQSRRGAGSSDSPTTGHPTGTVNYGTVMTHIGILQFMSVLVGFLVGVVMGALGAPTVAIYLVASFIGLFVLSGGFFWSALSVDGAVRWKHLAAVAVGVVVTTVIFNSMVFQAAISLQSLVLASVLTVVCMGIGGFGGFVAERTGGKVAVLYALRCGGKPTTDPPLAAPVAGARDRMGSD